MRYNRDFGLSESLPFLWQAILTCRRSVPCEWSLKELITIIRIVYKRNLEKALDWKLWPAVSTAGFYI